MQPEDYAYLHELEEEFWWFAGMREITATLLDPVCPPGKDRLILDAGCGTGGMLSWLRSYAGKGNVVGIDLFPMALEFCRRRGHEALAQASVVRLPFPDSTFDLLTSFDVLAQLPGEKSDELAIREMQRVLQPGGIVFVRVAAYEWMKSGHDAALGTQHRYLLSELVAKMKQAGFEILRESYANSVLMPVAMLRRLVLKRVGIANRGSDVKPLPAGLRWFNYLLMGALRAEAQLLKHRGVKLPAGLSAICLAKKPHP